MSKPSDSTKPDTILATAGRQPDENFGIVNPPVYHASTITFSSVAAWEKAQNAPFDHYTYGRSGTPTQRALEDAFAALEGCHRVIAVQSGLAAITGAIMGFVQAGDHMLVVDTAYGPTRRFANNVLKKFAVETTYYDPMAGAAEVERLIRPNTKLVFVETPGSLTFEVQDIPAVAAVAHKHGALVATDNSWATPLFYRPFERGVDISIYAATKYIVGHSDAMLGLICCPTREIYATIKGVTATFGYHAAPDDCYLGLRGLRTLGVRLRQHEKNALAIAHWLKARPEVARVLHPAFPECPGHDIWKRDFTGSSGLFSFILKPGYAKQAVDAFIDNLRYFGLGASWGGYESLILRAKPEQYRTARPWPTEDVLIRLHIGLEDVDDIKADLAQAFEKMNAA